MAASIQTVLKQDSTTISDTRQMKENMVRAGDAIVALDELQKDILLLGHQEYEDRLS
jgi:hypothetical protein